MRQIKGGERSLPAHRRSSGNGSPGARRQTVRPSGAVVPPAAQFTRMATRMDQLEGELDRIKRAWDSMGISRQGVNDQIEKNGADLSVQFQRIATMQAEIDRLKANELALHAEIERLRAARN